MMTIKHLIQTQQIVDDAIAIQQIASPTFAEQQRAAYVRERFAQYPLQDIAVDDLNNVYGRWQGANPSSPALLVSAHLDTVFPADADLSVRRTDDTIHGPGLGDNSLGVAALLALLEIFQGQKFQPPGDVWLVANSREEGMGDLGGIRAAWQKLGPRLGAAIVVEGMGLGRIYHAGIGVRRLRILCMTEGGHSWLHFGQPSAIHALIELGSQIITLNPPVQPRTTFNIGLINGGQTINSLAAQADLHLDLRSEAPDVLHSLEQQVMGMVDKLRRPGVEFAVQVVGDRPAGQISTDHPLVRMAAEILESIGQKPTFESGSTDANLLLAQGLPTVTIGITRGGNAHRMDEFIETGPIQNGIEQLGLLALSVAQQLPTWPKM